VQLAEQAKVDIIKSPKVTGNVTVKVTDVPLEEVLSNILAAHGYTYIPSENMIRVVPISEVAAAEKLVTRIYRISYADVAQVAKSLEKFVSKQGEISFNQGSSNIIVTDTESKVKAIDDFIEEIDRITPQVLIEARIYDVTATESLDLGVDWLASRNTPFTTVERTIDKTTTDSATTSKESITKTDKSWLTDETTGKRLEYTRRSKPFVGGDFKPLEGGALRFGLMDDAVDIEFVLNILRTELGAKLLANPRVLVLDNETATFKIVRQIPYSESTYTGQGFGLGVTSIEFKDVGIELEVTPHVTRDKMLRLKIAPKFSVKVSEVKSGGTGLAAVPIVDSREAVTTLLVEDGRTVVLGGLRKKEVATSVDKVPLLGDIPLLGGLFRSTSDEERTNELVVFITSKIVSETALSDKEARQLKATQFSGPEPNGP
jgi:type IV pilus assembly protein PilQ